MKARSRSAWGDWATFSGILQVTHITWRSIAGSDVRGAPASRWRGRSAPRPSAASGREQGERRRERQAAPAGVALMSCSASAMARSRKPVDLPAGDRHDVPAAVDDEALGQLVGAVGVREVAVVVAQVGVGEVVLVDEALGVGGGVEIGDAEDRRVAFEPALRAARAGAPRPGRVRTRRPRSSGPRPSRAAMRASCGRRAEPGEHPGGVRRRGYCPRATALEGAVVAWVETP